MAVIEFPAAAGTDGVQYYFGGSVDDVRLVGNDWYNGAAVNRVVRYAVTAPAEGASKISLLFNVAASLAAGAAVPLRFYIGTDPNSHINAWDTSEYTGELTRSADGYSFAAEVSMSLIPGITYYLFVFPAVKTYGLYYWYKYGDPVGLAMELSGGAGIVHVGNANGGCDMYQLFTRIGTTTYLLLPYVGNSNGGADLLS